MKKLVLIGAGGFGREVAASVIRIINKYKPTYEFLGFLDDGPQFHEGDIILILHRFHRWVRDEFFT